MILISIIIPIYNASNTLHNCIESVLQQTYKSFELILINDGSTDNSGQICESFAQSDDRIRIIHKDNGGVSSARNLGIEKTHGEWVTFVDSDDYIDINYLANFSKFIDDSTDLIIDEVIGIRKNEKQPLYNFKSSNTFSLNEFVKNFALYPYFAAPWGRLFKKSIIQENQLLYDSYLTWGEDTLFNLQYLKFCKRISVIDKAGYHYYFSDSGLSNKKYELSFYFKLIEKIESELSILQGKVNTYHKGWNLSIITGEILHIIYQSKDKRFRITFIKYFYANFKFHLISYFKESKVLGHLFTLLLDKKLFNIFDMIYLQVFQHSLNKDRK